jgi:molybdenum cofactor cytidylyltransferase
MLADQPEVDTTFLNSMIKKFTAKTEQIIATTYNSHAGVPAIFDQIYFDQLSVLVGDKGAKKLIGENLANVTTLSPKTSFIDIDTKEAYNQHHKIFFNN